MLFVMWVVAGVEGVEKSYCKLYRSRKRGEEGGELRHFILDDPVVSSQ